MITSKSLNQANMVFVVNAKMAMPANTDFTSLFIGDVATGINFIDDPIANTKFLNIPKVGLTVVWDGKRLRIDDVSCKDPENSDFVADAIEIYNKLFSDKLVSLEGFGFNFDVYYQLKDVVRINELFLNISPRGLLFGSGLVDLGWQWTIAHKDGERLDGFFVKVTAPMELAVHHNAHFSKKSLPSGEEAKKLFSAIYRSMHEIVGGLSL